jgi:hypothetical protein
MTKTTAALYTGHSYRIGASTHLFKIHNATPDTLKLLGGWDSDAYKSYLRARQSDFDHMIADLSTRQ